MVNNFMVSGEAEEDYLTCGRCLCEFPLQRITTFIEHKKQECDGPVADVPNKSRESGLQCVSCPMAFMTAMGMLKHVQFSHNLRLFLEKGAFAKGIQTASFPNSLPPSTSVQTLQPEKRTSPNRIVLERLHTTQPNTMSPSGPQGSRCPPAVTTHDSDQSNLLQLSLSDVTIANQRVTNAWNNSTNKSVFHSPKKPTNQSLKLSSNKALHSALTQSCNPVNQSLKSVPLQTKSTVMNQTQKSTLPQTKSTGMNQTQKPIPPQTKSTGMNQTQKPIPPQTKTTPMNQTQKPIPPQTKSTGMNQTQKPIPPQTKSTGINQTQKPTPPQCQSHSSTISQRTDSRQSAAKQPILFPVTSQSSSTLPKISIPVHLMNEDGSTPSDTSVLVGQDVGIGKVVPIVLLSGQMVDMAAKGCTPVQCTHNITSKSIVISSQVPSINTQSKVRSQSMHIPNTTPQVSNPSTPISSVAKQNLQSVNPLLSNKVAEMMEVISDAPQENQSLPGDGRDVLESDQLVEEDSSVVGGSLTVPMTTENVNNDLTTDSFTDKNNGPTPQSPAGGKTTVQHVHGDSSMNAVQPLKGDSVAAVQPSNRTVMDSCCQTEKSLKRDTQGARKSKEDTCCGRQNCGVTVIPGTHENTRKCCSSVLPKKRKRHMETKHMSYSWSRYNRRRLYSGLDKGRSGGTIYIDVEDVRDDPPRSQARTDGQGDLKVQVTGDEEGCKMDTNIPSTVTSRGSVILQPGATFSIPLPYNTVSSGSRPRTSTIPIPGAERRRPSELPTDSPSLSPVQATDRNSPPDLSGEAGQSVIFSEMLGMSNSDTGSDLDPNCVYYQGRKRRYPTSRPFKCDQCDNAFNQRIHLKKHMSKHTGIKPYKCQQCDYSTVERSHLKVHIRIHTGEKPFKCTYCEYATAQNSTLKIHLKRHHGSQLLECPTCAKSFTHYDGYQVHQQEHQGDTDGGQGQGSNGESRQDGGQGQVNLQSGLAKCNPKEEVSDPSDSDTVTIVPREQVEW